MGGRNFRFRVLDGPPKILGSKVPENFYLLPLHSSLFTKNAPENFEVIGNSEELKSESLNNCFVYAIINTTER